MRGDAVAGSAAARARQRLTPRAAWWLAHALWAVASIQALFGLLLAVLNRLPPVRFVAKYFVSQVAATLAFATVGALIASRRPRHAVG